MRNALNLRFCGPSAGPGVALHGGRGRPTRTPTRMQRPTRRRGCRGRPARTPTRMQRPSRRRGCRGCPAPTDAEAENLFNFYIYSTHN